MYIKYLFMFFSFPVHFVLDLFLDSVGEEMLISESFFHTCFFFVRPSFFGRSLAFSLGFCLVQLENDPTVSKTTCPNIKQKVHKSMHIIFIFSFEK